MAECEEEWKQAQEGNPSAERPNSTIPEELRLAYKDDMERGPPTPTPTPGTEADAETPKQSKPELPMGNGLLSPVARAGPVASVLARAKPPPSPLRATSSALESQSSTASARPHTALNQELSYSSTRSTPARQSPQVRGGTDTPTSARAVRQTVNSATAVPKWVDIAIVVLAVVIIYIAIGKFLA